MYKIKKSTLKSKFYNKNQKLAFLLKMFENTQNNWHSH